MVTVLILCSILIFFWEFSSDSTPSKIKDLQKPMVLKELEFSSIETFLIGIYLPIILIDLIFSSYEERNDMKYMPI